MSYAVHFLPAAEADLNSIFTYIQKRSSEGVLRWEASLEKALRQLSLSPLRYRLAPENKAFEFELRQILFGTQGSKRYRLLYRVVREQVTIYRLRGPGQAPLRDVLIKA